MKIKIELEVPPDEVPMAAELLTILRRITDHVSVNGRPASALSASPSAAGRSSAPPPNHAAAAAAAAARAIVSPSPATVPARPAEPAIQPAAAPRPSTAEMKQQILGALRAVKSSDDIEQDARRLEKMAWSTSAAQADAQRKLDPMFAVFVEAWLMVAVDPTAVGQTQAQIPYVKLLAYMSQSFKDAIRDAVVPLLLKHLAAKRPPGALRTEFYVQAEAFAGLAFVDIIRLEGAITTLSKMLREPAQRAAAITTLGKIAELCHITFNNRVSPDGINNLQAALKVADSEEYQYDINYIKETLGWTATRAVSAGATSASMPAFISSGVSSPLRPDSKLLPLFSLPGHSDSVFSLAHDPMRRHIFSSGKDGAVMVWGEDGHQVQAITLEPKGTMLTALNYHVGLGRVFGMGTVASRLVPQNPQKFCLAALDVGQDGAYSVEYQPRGVQASCLRCLSDTTGFLTAETLAHQHGAAMPGTVVVQYWDAGSGAPLQSLSPMQTFVGHSDYITALNRLVTTGTFASGARDSRLFLWDLRQSAKVAALGQVDPAKGGEPCAATAIITAIDCAGDNLLVSGSTDRCVRVWDVRMPGKEPLSITNVSNQVVVRVAVAPGGKAAIVSAMPGLFIMDLDDAAAPTLTPVSVPWPDSRPVQMYHDAKWNADGSVLFVAGKSKSMDMLAVTN